MASIFLILSAWCSAAFATEPGKLLNAVKTAATPSATARASASVDRTRDELRKMLYTDRKIDPTSAFGEQSSAFAQSVLLCLDEDRRVANPEKYRGCLLAAFESWNKKLLTLAYPDKRSPLCEAPKEIAKTEFHSIGFDQRDAIESAESSYRANETDEAAKRFDEALLAVESQLAKSDAGTLRCESDSGELLPKNVVAIDGGYCRALVARAKIFGKSANWESSLEYLDKSLRYRPLHLETLLERARVLHELRRRTDTIATASLILKQGQKLGAAPAVRAEAYALRARANTNLGNLKDARTDIAQALALQPENASYRDDLRYIDSLFQQKK